MQKKKMKTPKTLRLHDLNNFRSFFLCHWKFQRKNKGFSTRNWRYFLILQALTVSIYCWKSCYLRFMFCFFA